MRTLPVKNTGDLRHLRKRFCGVGLPNSQMLFDSLVDIYGCCLVAGERLSVDQQIPTRHTGVSRDLSPYYQQIRNDQESNAERRRRLYYIPQNPAAPPSVGVHYHRLPASLLHFMESGAIFMHHDGEPKLVTETFHILPTISN